jgi:hypothetical protein
MKSEAVIKAAEKVGLLNPSQAEIMKLHLKEAELCAELKPYVYKSSLGSPMISHPLVIEIFFDPEHCALINYRLELKKQMLEEYAQAKNWLGYIFAHERPYRIGALCDLYRKYQVNEPKYVKNVWIDSENIWQHRGLWKLIWATLPDPQATMDPNEKAVFNLMPERVTIHRGIRHRTHNRRGMSWTRDKERASFFAGRYGGQKGLKPVVLTTEVPKKNILAYFNSRGEEEVIVMPHKLGRKLSEFQIG